MADPGSVSYLFNRKGVIIVEKTKDLTEDDVLLAVLDAGAEEVNDLGDSFEVISEPTDLVAVRTALQDAGIDYESADAAFLPSSEIDLDEDQARKVLKLIDALEDSDDVQDVYANYNVSRRHHGKARLTPFQVSFGCRSVSPSGSESTLPSVFGVVVRPYCRNRQEGGLNRRAHQRRVGWGVVTDVVIRPITLDDDFDAQLDLGQRAFGVYPAEQKASWLLRRQAAGPAGAVPRRVHRTAAGRARR